ncbi:hypothetical protein DITRI_Ditri10aG0142200 [Diplodiscus trichospermus]
MSSEPAPCAPKRILITGAAGFIASHVTVRLIKNYPDHKIVALDKLDYCCSLKNLQPCLSSPNFKFVKGDTICADLVNYLLLAEDIDTIMHFAAQTHVDNSFGNSFEVTNNNIYGTHLLPTNPYSATKAGAEMLVMAYHRAYGLPTITTRGNNVYGPNQYPEKLIPKFILLAMKGEQLPIHGNGTNVRSYLSCDDVAEALDAILHKGVLGHVYNIGTQRERRVVDVAEDICKLFELKPKEAIRFVQDRPFNDQRYFLDDQKLKKLGWQERTSWVEGLKIEIFDIWKNRLDWRFVGKTLQRKGYSIRFYLLLMNFSTGCIFEYDKEHQRGSGIGFKEEDKPNFTGSFYSKTKAMVEELLNVYDNVCTLRVRMPISSDLSNPRNFITKITRYNKVVNIPNSMTVLDELLPLSIEMAKRKCKGIWNFTNPGVISQNEILEMYRAYIDPQFKCENFSLEEQAKVIVAPRSNNELDATKLKNEFPELLSIKDSIIKYVFKPHKKT